MLSDNQIKFIKNIKKYSNTHRNRVGNIVYMWSCNCQASEFYSMTNNFKILSDNFYHIQTIKNDEMISLSLCEGDLILVHCDNFKDWQRQKQIIESE